MALKRKRSSPNISPESTSSYATSARDSTSPTPAPYPTLSAVPQHSTWWTSQSSSLNSRTRKRWRDNRPDESVLHRTFAILTRMRPTLQSSSHTDRKIADTTVQKLFDAQRQHPHAEPMLSVEQSHVFHHPMTAPIQKSNLHAFWSLPHSRKPAFSSLIPPQESQLSLVVRCEDCEVPLSTSMGADVEMGGMDLDDELACSSCRKRVCDMCAVRGEERRCLECCER